MPLLLRTVRQNRWYKHEAKPFLDKDDAPADPMSDLITQENMLSVWVVADNRSNLERCVRAVALCRDHIADYGYVVFPSNALEGAGIEVIENAGKSPDNEANAWHRDLSLSGKKMVALVRAILLHGESGQLLKAQIRQLMDEGIQQGQLPPDIKSRFKTKQS